MADVLKRHPTHSSRGICPLVVIVEQTLRVLPSCHRSGNLSAARVFDFPRYRPAVRVKQRAGQRRDEGGDVNGKRASLNYGNRVHLLGDTRVLARRLCPTFCRLIRSLTIDYYMRPCRALFALLCRAHFCFFFFFLFFGALAMGSKRAYEKYKSGSLVSENSAGGNQR